MPYPKTEDDKLIDTVSRELCMIGDRENNSATLVKLGDRVIDNGKANYALLAKYIREHLDQIRNT